MYARNSAYRAAYKSWLKYQQTKMEGGNLRKWWKGEGTIGLAFSGPVNYINENKYDSVENSHGQVDTTIKGKATPLLSFHINMNSNHLLMRLSGSSILSISVGTQVDILRWKHEVFSGNTVETISESLVYAQIGVPVTLDYKWGCDVDFDPDQKACFAVGVGGMPLVGTGISGFLRSGGVLRVSPYLYASFGFYAWGCWKIRASYMPGKYTMAKDQTIDYGGSTNTLNAQGSNIIMLGISHMSYSRDWGKGNAWRGGGGRHHNFEGGRMF